MTGTSGSRTAPPLAAARRAFYLAPHAATPCEAVRSIAVELEMRTGGALELVYAVESDPRRVRLPEPAAPRRVDGLWRHTCFEAFIRPAGAPEGPYVELNLSPSGEWAAYAFEDYRRGMRPFQTQPAPVITLESEASGDRWKLRAAVALGPFAGGRARLALAAVIEDADGQLAYWALRHPLDRPDFHHPDAFAAAV